MMALPRRKRLLNVSKASNNYHNQLKDILAQRQCACPESSNQQQPLGLEKQTKMAIDLQRKD